MSSRRRRDIARAAQGPGATAATAAQGNPHLGAALLSAELLHVAIQRQIIDSALLDLSLVIKPEAGFADVVLPFEAGVATLMHTIGSERAIEAVMRASKSARVSVDANIGVWDSVTGFVRLD